MEKEELRIVIESLLDKIPERNCNIIRMKYYKNMTSREIGEQLGISPGNVRIIMKRTLSMLEKMMTCDFIVYE